MLLFGSRLGEQCDWIMAKPWVWNIITDKRDLKEASNDKVDRGGGILRIRVSKQNGRRGSPLSLLSNLSLLPEGLSLFTSLGTPPEQESGRYCWKYCQVIRKSNGHKMTSEAMEEKPEIKLPPRNQGVWECLCNWQTTKPPPFVGKDKFTEKLRRPWLSPQWTKLCMEQGVKAEAEPQTVCYRGEPRASQAVQPWRGTSANQTMKCHPLLPRDIAITGLTRSIQ